MVTTGYLVRTFVLPEVDEEAQAPLLLRRLRLVSSCRRVGQQVLALLYLEMFLQECALLLCRRSCANHGPVAS